MNYLKPRQGDENTVLDADELKSIKPLRAKIMLVSNALRAAAVGAERRGNAADHWRYVEAANTLAETCLGLERVERTGGSKLELVGEFSPLACATLAGNLLPIIAGQFGLDLATKDPGLYAYADDPYERQRASNELAALETRELMARAQHALERVVVVARGRDNPAPNPAFAFRPSTSLKAS